MAGDDTATTGGQAPIDAGTIATLTAVATTVYPSDVDGVGTFVERYVTERARRTDERARGIANAVETLEEYTRTFHDEPFRKLSPALRRETLDQMGVDTADPVPDGTEAERVRHYVVNDLLFAFYASPAGAELAGLENPPGYPGGIESYREGPDR